MSAKRISQADFITSIYFMLLSALALALAAAFAKNITTYANLTLAIFIRFCIPFILLILISPFSKLSLNLFKEMDFKPHLLRAVFTVLSQFCFFYLLYKGNLLIATLFFSTNGLVSPFLSRIFFRKPIRVKTLIAIIVSFIGVFITLGTTKDLFSWYTAVGLLSGLFGAASQVTLHYCSKRQNLAINNLCMYGFSTILSFLVLICSNQISLLANIFSNISWFNYAAILLFSIFSIANQSLRSVAYKFVNNAASLSPFLYASFIFSGIIDWVWLGVHPHWYTYVGTLIVMLGGIIMAFHRSNKKEEISYVKLPHRI